jgi:thioredoxin reductase (NADPH)
MPGFPDGVGGMEFSERLRRQAERFGVELLQAQDVTRVRRHHLYQCVTTGDGKEYSARALLVSTGSSYRRLNVPGENDYLGAGVHFCATCDGPFYRGKRVAVVGGGNSATEESLFLTKFADHVTILVRGDKFRATQIIQDKVLTNPQITVRWKTEVKEFLGAGSKLTALRLREKETGSEEMLPVDGAFIFIGLTPNTGFLKGSGIKLNRWGFVVTGRELLHEGRRPAAYEGRDPHLLETSVPGIFAAGDVRDGSTKQVASAAGEGASAALMIREYLKGI